MRDRITIRRTAPNRWTARIPTVGFGQGEVVHRPTHADALREADRRIKRESSNVVTTETTWQPTDRVSTVPTWTPLIPVDPY